MRIQCPSKSVKSLCRNHWPRANSTSCCRGPPTVQLNGHSSVLGWCFLKTLSSATLNADCICIVLLIRHVVRPPQSRKDGGLFPFWSQSRSLLVKLPNKVLQSPLNLLLFYGHFGLFKGPFATTS